MRTRLFSGSVVAAFIATFAFGGGQPLAQGRPPTAQPGCGAVITTDTKLDRDLVDCAGDGIVIGADNITLDLAGNTVDGDATPGSASPDIGIRNDGYDGVTIKDGTIQEFDFGARLDGPSGNALLGLVSTRNSRAGIRIQNSDGNRLVGNTAASNGAFGIIFFGENHYNLVERNTVTGNAAGGIGDFVSDHDRIVHNVVAGNGEDGISVGGSTDTLVEHNAVSENFAGIAIFGSDRNTVTGNRVFRNSDDIFVDGNDNSVLDNLVTDALGCDDGQGCGFGISIEGGGGNLVARNSVAGTLSSGIRLDAYGAPVMHNVFRGNVVRSAGVDGIAIGTDQAGPVLDTFLEGNVVTGAKDDGIDVDSPATTLTRNLALHNGDLGIEAVAGVLDGGGNRAAGNGNPAQCTNVAC